MEHQSGGDVHHHHHHSSGHSRRSSSFRRSAPVAARYRNILVLGLNGSGKTLLVKTMQRRQEAYLDALATFGNNNNRNNTMSDDKDYRQQQGREAVDPAVFSAERFAGEVSLGVPRCRPTAPHQIEPTTIPSAKHLRFTSRDLGVFQRVPAAYYHFLDMSGKPENRYLWARMYNYSPFFAIAASQREKKEKEREKREKEKKEEEEEEGKKRVQQQQQRRKPLMARPQGEQHQAEEKQNKNDENDQQMYSPTSEGHNEHAKTKEGEEAPEQAQASSSSSFPPVNTSVRIDGVIFLISGQDPMRVALAWTELLEFFKSEACLDRPNLPVLIGVTRTRATRRFEHTMLWSNNATTHCDGINASSCAPTTTTTKSDPQHCGSSLPADAAAVGTTSTTMPSASVISTPGTQTHEPQTQTQTADATSAAASSRSRSGGPAAAAPGSVPSTVDAVAVLQMAEDFVTIEHPNWTIMNLDLTSDVGKNRSAEGVIGWCDTQM